MLKQASFIISLLLILISCSHRKNAQEAPIPGSLEEAISSSFRSDDNVSRDKYLNPQETLEFFGLRPDFTVVEIAPGAGYFTEILAPYLVREGQYVMAVPRLPARPPRVLIENERKLQDILLRNSEVAAQSKFIPLEPIGDRNRTKREFADLVLSFNNTHNWIAQGKADEIFRLFFDILKPEGVLGITQHRARPGKRRVPKSGYLSESEVIALAQKAGFTLVGSSEINANPRDPTDHPGGVWTLPPSYRLGKKDRYKYKAIGESDRMTLKFVKPSKKD